MSRKNTWVLLILTILFLTLIIEMPQIATAATSTGTLQVSTNTGGANIYLNGNLNGTTDSWGNSNINNVPNGQYAMEITKVGYKDYAKQTIIDTGKTTYVYAYLESGIGTATTRQEAIPSGQVSGTLKVVSTEGASIYVDNEFGGIIDTWGNGQVNGLLKGTYTLKLTLLGYKNWIKTISIEPGLSTTVYAYLEPGTGDGTTRAETIYYNSAYGILQVHSSSDIKVYVNNEYGGTIDTWGVLKIDGLLSGTYTLKLIEVGYKEYSKQVTITPGQTTQIYAALEAGTGTATTRNETISFDSQVGTLKVQGIDGTNVYVGNEYGGTIDWGVCQINGLLPGNYEIKLIAKGYKDWVNTTILTAGQTTTIISNQVAEETPKPADTSTAAPTDHQGQTATVPPVDISTPESTGITFPVNSTTYLNFLIAGCIIAIISVIVVTAVLLLSKRNKETRSRNQTINTTQLVMATEQNARFASTAEKQTIKK